MIHITNEVDNAINDYVNYLINSGETSQKRAFEKKRLMFQSLRQNLGGLVTHRLSPYTKLGKDFGCRIYVYTDPKSRTQWGFAYKINRNNNIIVYAMKNMYLVNEKKEISYPERFNQIIEYIERNFDGKPKRTENSISLLK